MRMLGSHVDITERKIAEQQLTEKSFLLSESQRIGHIGTWSYEFSNNQIQWSDETYRIYGVSPHTFVPTSESFFNLVHPDDRAKMQELVRACQFGEKPEELEFRIVRTDGSIRTLSGRGELLSGNDSAPARMVGTVQDITERKQAEEKQARLVALLEATPDLVGIANADGLPLFINKAGRRAFGIKDDEDLSKIHILDFRPEWAIPIIQEAFQEAIRLGVWTGETVLLNRDGHEIPVSQVIVAHKSADNKVRFFSSIMRDLTEQKKLEEQVRQSQKMDAIGQLAGGVAHDFNNLLTVISGYSELLLVKVPINDPMRESIKAISEAGERAASLTRQLLAFSRQTVMESKILDLNTIVSDTEKMLRRLIGEDILLTAVLDPTISRVKVDPGQIGQVLMNLAVNARDAMPKGGKLTIETGNIKLDEMYVRMHPEVQAGRYVMLVMSDTGCGMTPLIKSHIFEPFFTTKGVGKGTGLGLAVVHGIIMQSGGHVEVYSEPNLGTTFKIYLPAVDEEIETSDKLYADNHLRGTETLLLVEDEESVRELVCLVLQTHGYKVVQANDGKEALRMLERHNVRIDLLVTDVVMPGMGGRELAEFLLPKFPQMKALYMSGYTDDAVVRHGILQAEIDFIQKPYSPHALLRKIRQVLDRK
jgi:PAS domain S-box-containing protein